jgi:hypothetical protein
MAARRVGGDSALASLVRERQDLIREWQWHDNVLISASSTSQEAQLAKHRDRVVMINSRFAAIRREMAHRFPEYVSLVEPRPLSVSELQAQLRPDEALVLFLSAPAWTATPNETFLWSVTRETMRWTLIPLGMSDLTKKVQALRCGLDSEEWEGISRPARCGRLLGISVRPGLADPLPFDVGIAHELYQDLLGPVEDQIKDKHLLIVPSGPLTSLPFQVLVTEQPKFARPKTFDGYKKVAWLGRRQPLTILPSVASLQALREFAKASTAEKPYLGYGSPVLLGEGGCRRSITKEACTPPVLVAANDPMPPRERPDVRSGSIDWIYRRGASQEAVIT